VPIRYALLSVTRVTVRTVATSPALDAGIALVATLAQRLGIAGLVDRFVRVRRDRPGAANVGRKVMRLIYAMALGADSIDDGDMLRSGRTGRLLGGGSPGPRHSAELSGSSRLVSAWGECETGTDSGDHAGVNDHDPSGRPCLPPHHRAYPWSRTGWMPLLRWHLTSAAACSGTSPRSPTPESDAADGIRWAWC
jgi:hypothetical protein